MKKSLIALAVLAASGAAMAQSSVTVFGVVDEAVSYVNGGTNWNGINSGGNATSRIGFRGVEDLGGGLKANFWLEAGILADSGSGQSGGASGSGLEFKRRSTVGLEGGFGEVRLGRDLTEAYKATSRYDVFGQVGFGVSRLWADANLGAAYVDSNGVTRNNSVALTTQRVSNMVTYVSPNISGFKAAVNYGFGEVQGENRDSRYVGAGLTYDNGPLSLGLSGERSNRGANSNLTRDVTAWALGGSYDLGVVKLSAAYRDSKAKVVAGDKDKAKGYYFGLSAPVGAAGEVKASYNRYEGQRAGADKYKADQFALGYVHNLSKRTAVYGTYAYIKNKDDGALGINLNGTTGGTLKDNGSQHGLQVGIRHAF
ncbi:porin [Comamonas terrigena]|uniref:porin n=1 Tax=Comamonas terrigena TaxID=32013 RepID=UPI0024488098|nr:porin [Comamonas terrigena]MDH0048010.1 porin [Comamonas terrigena]MDH0510390.1 porin [Comamonas terrigena]MDH1089992.1 porin [Comamonas terrigena]MDH1291894.1 porin [Comamonas terrigena]MDH1499864.1 porin [Comamonas terrigena]